MPSELVAQRGLSTPTSSFLEEKGLSEKEPGFWQSQSMHFFREKEPFGFKEEAEVQTIRSLLPDEDDLFSGMIGDFEYGTHNKGQDDSDDFDLFSSVGGLELEDDASCVSQKNSDIGRAVINGGSLLSKCPYSKPPSRTLVVRNVNSEVEDSDLRALFEQYGDIRSLYAACKYQGFVTISYFDIRAAANAMGALQNKLFHSRKLDIHYSFAERQPSTEDISHGIIAAFDFDSSISNDKMQQIFSIYGDIKEIHEAPQRSHHKLIEFYDVRSAEAALCALNKTYIAGRQMMTKPRSPEDARKSLTTWSSSLKQDEVNMSSNTGNILSQGGAVSCLRSNSVQSLHSAHCGYSTTLAGDASCNRNSYDLRSVASSGKCYDHQTPSQAWNHMQFGSMCLPSFHPYSFIDCRDKSNTCIPDHPSGTAANIAEKLESRMTDSINGSELSLQTPNGPSVEHQGLVSASSADVNFPSHGHHRSTYNSLEYGSVVPSLWPYSTLPSDGFYVPSPPQVHTLPGVPPAMVNSVTPPPYPRVGSDPSVNPLLWDRKYVYAGQSLERSSPRLNSFRGVEFSASSPRHHLARDRLIVSHSGRNSIEKHRNEALHSPHQMSHIFHGRNVASSLPSLVGSPRDYGRNLSHRRNKGSSFVYEKERFELDIDRILSGEDSRTTLMLKNIPNKYTAKMLLSVIDEHCRGIYDFIYLPIDFKNKCNVGYAFINLINPLQVVRFHKEFSGRKWEKFNSEKVVALAYARIQGKASLISHFQNSSLMNEDKRCRPILFHTDGPNAGEQEPFPVGTNIRSRTTRARSHFGEMKEGSLNRSDSSDSSCSTTESE